MKARAALSRELPHPLAASPLPSRRNSLPLLPHLPSPSRCGSLNPLACVALTQLASFILSATLTFTNTSPDPA